MVLIPSCIEIIHLQNHHLFRKESKQISMPRLINQSSIDENVAMFLQYGLSEDSEQTINDDIIAREIQQQYQNNLLFDDAAIAWEIQQDEGT